MSEKSVKFHIKSADYFGTLATVLNLVMQDLKNNNFNKDHQKILDNCIKDLIYLQNKYKIS